MNKLSRVAGKKEKTMADSKVTAKRKFIQVGITALRDPKTGGFLPTVPLYIEAIGDAEPAEAAMIRDVSKVFAERMKQYIDGGGKIRQRRRKSIHTA